MKFEIWKDESGQWWWRAVASNGQVIATPHEGYKNKAHALRMARKLSGVDVLDLVHNNIQLALNNGGVENMKRQLRLALSTLEKTRSRVIVK